MSHTKRFLSFALALIMCLSLTPMGRAAEEFSDVPATYWAYSDIMACAQAGTVNGMGDGRFDPEGPVTDIQFIVMLTRTFYSEQVEDAKATETSSWYAPNVKVAGDVGMTNNLPALNDAAMSRYNMAMALYNVMVHENKVSSATGTMLTNAMNSIKDWDKVPVGYQTAVLNCYALGIITGMSDGSFSGSGNMTRAQACVVITRMLDLVVPATDNSNQTGADEKPDSNATVSALTITPRVDGNVTWWNIADTNNSTGTLSNGKAITEANIQEILDLMRKQFPTGMTWTATGAANNAYDNPGTVSSHLLGSHGVDAQMACGGFASMVSDAIFGKSANPARQVTDMSKVRTGDVVICLNRKTGIPKHIMIITKISDYYYYSDGNDSAKVEWEAAGKSAAGYTNGNSLYTYEVWTRYPEEMSE